MSGIACVTNYLFFQGGPGHSRHPRSNPPTGGLIPIPGINGASGTITLPEACNLTQSAAYLLLPQPTWQAGPGPVTYVFLSISGAASGNQTWIAPPNYATLLQQNPSQLLASIGNVVTGANPITLTYVYGPPNAGGGPPQNDSGASIDCFFEGTSSIVDNVFIAASPDNGATASGNNFGWVDTWTTAETITAQEFITPDGVDPNEVSAVFLTWIDLLNPGQSAEFSGKALNAAKGQNYFALALYRVDPCQSWRTLLANFNISDYPNAAAADKALLGIRANLLECERLNGELPATPLPIVKP